jgi:hypothetical protein
VLIRRTTGSTDIAVIAPDGTYIGLSLGTLAALGIAHTPGGLFQFREIGLRPAPQTVIAIAAESLATLLLTVAVLEGRARTPDQAVIAAAASPTRRPTCDAA